ncbi:MAG TPA: sigma-70 family RNA polymerase sigma factor [Flavitalea sp.]|nr:sigma-70 family RNA polymerase sigma factor [Flavitalea sp.]
METAYSAGQFINQLDLTSFDALYYQYHQAVYANIWKMVKLHEVAEDILQEVFMALWQNRHKLNPEKVAGWLFVTSHNKTIKYLKKTQKEQSVALEKTNLYNTSYEEDPISEEGYNFQLSIVEEAVNCLPARKKAVFILCRYEGKSYDDVANILGISVSSVRDYLKQSNRFIKTYIAHNYTQRGIIATSLLIIYFS